MSEIAAEKHPFITACEPFFFGPEPVMVGDKEVNLSGTISIKGPGETNDNPFLFTATYLFICELLGIPKDQWRKQKLNLDNATWLRKLKVGLYDAYPSWSGGTLSHDEILGLGMISPEIAEDLHGYGVKHLWVFNNRRRLADIPTQWMGRFPLLIAYLRSRAGIKQLDLFVYAWACAELNWADRDSPHGETSGKCQRFIMAYWFFHNADGALKEAARSYLTYLENAYEDVQGLYAVYFPYSPFAVHTRGVRFLPRPKAFPTVEEIA